MMLTNANLDHYVPDFKIEIDGDEQNKLKNAVISIEVDENLDNHSMFTINLNEIFNLKEQKFEWQDNSLILPEKNEVKIYMGYANDPEKFNEPLITGQIVALNPNFPASGIPTLSVQGYDYSFQWRKTLVNEKRPFEKIKDYKMFIERAVNQSNPGLDFTNIKATLKPCEKITAYSNENNYDFIKRLANRVGYEFFIRNEKVYFREPVEEKEIITLNWGSELISFNPRLSTAGVVNKVTIRGHNQSNPSKAIEGVAEAKNMANNETDSESASELVKNQNAQNSDIEISKSNFPVCDVADANAVAKALLIKSNNKLIEASCECVGMPGIRPGENVIIDGIGQRFKGKYYIKSIKHSIGDGGYRMSFEVRRGVVGATGSN